MKWQGNTYCTILNGKKKDTFKTLFTVFILVKNYMCTHEIQKYTKMFTWTNFAC